MISDAEMILENHDSNIFNINYNVNLDTRGVVSFSIGSQGSVVGGQYWYILYSPYDDFIDGKSIYINKKDDIIEIIEKIEDNWYFYYIDYDGKIDLTQFQ